MTIDFMRKVDYWAGVPLTALLTLWLRLIRPFRKPLDPLAAKKVLFIELSEMGSAILADPALKKVSQTRDVYFVIFKKNSPSLRIFNTVKKENIFTIRDTSFFALMFDVLRFLIWCRKTKLDAIVDLELFSRFTAALSALSSAPVRIGFFNPRSEGLYRGRILTHPVAYNPHIHIAKNMIALIEPFFHTLNDPLVRRTIRDDEIELEEVIPATDSVNRVLEAIKKRVPEASLRTRFFLVNVNAGDFLPQRKWPRVYFETFVKNLLKAHLDVKVLLTGSPQERASVDEVARNVNSDRCINIAGDLLFDDLPALYSIAEGILTNDSGPGHFASAVGLRTFVLFGPETPHLYGPLKNATAFYAGLACSPCVYATNHRNTPCTDNQCLKVIQPSFVFERVSRYLSERNSIEKDMEHTL